MMTELKTAILVFFAYPALARGRGPGCLTGR
nr:hypothetical protein RNT25_04282 [arsenite-oxidising bacterium NT-25]